MVMTKPSRRATSSAFAGRHQKSRDRRAHPHKGMSAHSASSERSMGSFLSTLGSALNNAANVSEFRGGSVSATLQWSTKNKERAGCNKNEADGIIPGDRLLEIENGEAGKHQQRDDLLDGLELGGRIDRTAESIGRNGHAVFHECDPPACQDGANERRLLEAQVPVPGQRHEHVGTEQQQDRKQRRRQQNRWHVRHRNY